jgi:hypothetical protein
VFSFYIIDVPGRHLVFYVVVTEQHYLQLKEILQRENVQLKLKEYKIKEDRVHMHKNKIYVPSFGELRNLVLKKMNNLPDVEHPSYQKTISAIRSQYFFPGMKKDVVEYISRCMECQRVKVKHRHPAGLLQPLSIQEKKREVVTIDFITKLAKIERQHDSIMVVVIKLTKVAHFVPIKMTHTIVNIA